MGDDWMDDDFGAPAPAARPERELIPDGTYELEIVDAIDEPDRLQVRLAHENKGYAWVFCNIPKTKDWGKRIAHELREALGIAKGGLMAAVAAGELKGRRVKVRVYQRVSGERTFVNVAEIHKADDKPAPAPVVARTPRQKADRAATATDDIPF
jgi:hypothetical protein